jgi:hypothetical protein
VTEPIVPRVDDRVVITTNARVPLDIEARIAGRARWLLQELPKIDAELDGVPYPRIEIIPVCWVNVMGDGSGGLVPGCVGPRPVEDNLFEFVVQLAAASLIEYADDDVLAVLSHEYLHFVHLTLELERRGEAGGSNAPFHLGPGEPDYTRSAADYGRIDRAAQVSPQDWLSPRLCRVLEKFEATPSSAVDAVLYAIKKNWVDRGLPVEQFDHEHRSEGTIRVPEAIVERERRRRRGNA